MRTARRDDSAISRWVCFELDEQMYGLPINVVQEVLADAVIEPVPGTTPMVLGVINLRGNVVTVLDLRRRFGFLPKDDSPGNRVVVVDHGSESLGLAVDRVADVRKLADSAIKPVPDTGAETASAGIHGIVSREGQLLTLLDVKTLLQHSLLVA